MGPRAVRVVLAGFGVLTGALATVSPPVAAQVAIRTCNVPTLVHERTLAGSEAASLPLGAPLPGPDPADRDADEIPLADLDFDGRPEQLTGGSAPALALSTLDSPRPLPSPGRPLPADATYRASRVGITTRLSTSGPGGPTEVWTVENTCARSWLGRASRWVLGTQPTDDAALGDLDPTAPLTLAQRRTLAAAVVRSVPARTHLVDQRFHTALHRDADPAAITSWVEALGSGRRTAEQLTASLFGSTEFYVTHGATPDGWVTGLYRQGTGQEVDPDGATYWKAVAERDGRERAAARFFATPGARRALVAATYRGQFVLDRAADPSGLDRGFRLLAAGGWDAFQVALLASDEFYLKAQSSNRLRPN